MRQVIKASTAFAGVFPAGVDLLVISGTWPGLAPGDTLFPRGNDADALFLIAEGGLNLLMSGPAGPETVMAELGPGDITGEIQLLTGGKRIATVRATTAARVIRFAKDVFERLAAPGAALIDRIRSVALERLRRNHLASILPAQFGDLDFRQMEEIESLGRGVTLDKGQVLFRQGDAGDGAYILVNGLLGVLVRQPHGTARLVNHIQHGEVVGEMALLSD